MGIFDTLYYTIMLNAITNLMVMGFANLMIVTITKFLLVMLISHAIIFADSALIFVVSN